MSGLLRRPLQIEGAHKPPPLVHEINDTRVVDRIIVRIFAGNLLGVDPECLGKIQGFLRVACKAENAGIEIFEIGSEHFRRVALRIDGHEDCGDFFIWPELLEHLRNIKERRGAEVRAMRIAEKDEIGPPRQLFHCHCLAAMPDQRKRPPDGGARETALGRHQSVNQAAEAGQAKPKAKNGIKKVPRRLFLGIVFH